MRVYSAALVALAVCVLASLCQAEPARDPAAAEALFTQGRTAFEKGDYFTACEKFAESQKLDPAAGTLINLAACNERLGKLATAWETWQSARRWLHPTDERRGPVEARIAALEGRLPKLEVRLGAETPPRTQVFRDGVEIGRASFGIPLPVDPGRRTVRVRAPGHKDRIYTAWLKEGEVKGLVVQPGAALPKPKPRKRPKQQAPVVVHKTYEQGLTTQQILGISVGAAGLVAVGVGGVTGLMALGKKEQMDDNCELINEQYYCGRAGLDAADTGGTLATVSTISFIAGGAALGAAGYLLLTADTEPRRELGVRLGRDSAGVSLKGAF